ncbi:MAG: multicopper oxidase family protein [Gammaproteobacteria bacterium]
MLRKGSKLIEPFRRNQWLGMALITLALAGVAAAQTTCPPPELQRLQQPPEIDAQGGMLSTTFVVKMQEHPCVPVFNGTKWITQPMTLRTYFYPPAGSSQLTWSTPGATLRVRRATTPTSGDGDSLKILLVNQLPVPSIPDSQCDAACPSGSNCCPPPGQPCPSTCTKGCPQETFPECFHGDNTTNLHFHGTHVSPQAPQDYVLLELAPAGTPAGQAGHTRNPGVSTSGQYQYAVNPFPSNQAEGTHWYHPHKHGSVSLQLLNGMGGALLIEGPFDDWLNGFYKPQGGLSEKVLVIQQLDDVLNFFRQDPAYAPPQPLINGQANPIVSMQPGEIQRWRLVNESMQASAQLQIGFENTSAPILKQIAQDGVQFAPQNYGSQPLLSQGVQNFSLSPGNRADFLVQAPSTPGTHLLTFQVIGFLEHELKARADSHRRALLKNLTAKKSLGTAATSAANPPLLTVRVGGNPKPMSFPTQAQWPPTPPFLADIQESEIFKNRSVLFSMTGVAGIQQNAFYINGKQFDPSCVDETMTLGKAEQWAVSNNSAPKHPFHIHTNPFQIIAMNGQALPAPWIWWDTFGLPAVSTTPQDVNAGPIFSNQQAQQVCPGVCTKVNANWNGQWKTTVPSQMSVCGCLSWGSITTRSRFLDFTGEYVVHCHFLGHEDRGMMIGVQTVCPSIPQWGTTVAAGTADNCSLNLPASAQCPN